jgi:ATP-dependent RNA/DNA helicase IGHMBP2
MLRVVDLPGPIMLVPSRRLDERLLKLSRDHRGLPTGIDQVVSDLNGRRDGVAVRFSEPRRDDGGWSLLLYTHAYVIVLYPSQQDDAYTVVGIDPVRLRDHDRLADGALLVRTGWQYVLEYRFVPRGRTNYWSQLWQYWNGLTAASADQRAVPVLSAEHVRFLDTLDGLIDATERITSTREEAEATYPYRAVESVGERRHSALPVYTFRVVGGRTPDWKQYVQVRGEAEQRGQVVRAENDRVTVRFDQPVDWTRLPQQGELEVTRTNIVFAKQREAVMVVRNRQARNKTLMSVLVDHHVQPVREVVAHPAEELDDDQLTAFRKALGTSDLTAVVGPPGTGKTRTISQIARACALTSGPGPVLIASHTNRAVDNVLAKLPRDMVVVRVGNEGKIDPDTRHLLLERLAADLRAEIIGTTGAALNAYGHLHLAWRWTEELGRRVGALNSALDEEAAARIELARARRAVAGPHQNQVDELEAQLGGLAHRQEHRQQRLDRIAKRNTRARTRMTWPLLGVIFRKLVTSRERLLATGGAELAGLAQDIASVRQRLGEAENALDAATRDDPAVRVALGFLRQKELCIANRRTAALEAVRAVRAIDLPVDPPPEVRDQGDNATTAQDLAGLYGWLQYRLPLLTARAGLLTEWHDEVSGATEQLYPELIRYADVIGATCIGAASRSEIAAVDFDLAIVDEAGQIGVADLLVPLTRARRAVLVGDHNQLPPFVDAEVEQWGRELGDATVRSLLTTSGFEMLVKALPASHITILTVQRRMPEVIADFISNAFYGGRLRSKVERQHDDPLFRRPLAFVDTSRLTEAQRFERAAVRRDARGGKVNPAEARMLARLAGFYHCRGTEWALIVPYAEQVRMIMELLRDDIAESDVIAGNVGTVDSFQGGERDLILYGFTRSNAEGRVGFLDELRRANVAFTRVKRQLVLVGDMGTLVRASDDEFRRLACALRDHIVARGDRWDYRELRARLETLEAAERTP